MVDINEEDFLDNVTHAFNDLIDEIAAGADPVNSWPAETPFIREYKDRNDNKFAIHIWAEGGDFVIRCPELHKTN